MTWMINKVCYDPENDVSYDAIYAENRFSRRMRLNLPKINLMIAGEGTPSGEEGAPLITGTTPVYADFLVYACLYDLRNFVPKCFHGANNRSIFMFFRHFDGLPELKEWFEGEGKEGEYIRPAKPSITIRIGYFA